MVFSASLKEPIVISGIFYHAARLSIEINDQAGPQFKIEGVNDVCSSRVMSNIY